MNLVNTTNSLPFIDTDGLKSSLIVYPRLHFFSLDLSDYIGILKHGSFGMSLFNFPIKIECYTQNKIDEISFNNSRTHHLDYNIDLDKLRKKLNCSQHFNISISIPNDIQEHTGIGLSTQIVGGVYLLCAKHCGVDLSISDLFELGVGHVSTLGLNLLFNPGIIVENGVNYKNNVERPVNAIIKFDSFPFWTIVAIPNKLQSLSAELEYNFCNNLLPESVDSTKSVYREFYGECIPAIIEKDFEAFASSIDKVVRMGTKAKEERIQSEGTQKLLSTFRDLFGCAGVSSMGPTIYSFAAKNPSEQLEKIKNEQFNIHIIEP